jgi:F0F1-type ATP synthase assembly protein I
MPLFTPEIRKQLKDVGRLSAVGIEVVISTVLGLLAGIWLDEKLNTAPYLKIVGLILGTIAGFKSVYQTARRAARREQNERKK